MNPTGKQMTIEDKVAKEIARFLDKIADKYNFSFYEDTYYIALVLLSDYTNYFDENCYERRKLWNLT